MADIILELSGKAGLSNNHAGDADMITPQPNLRTAEQEGQFVQGIFNPYLRSGYLAPSTDTSTALTLDVASATELSSVVVDRLNKDVYFADSGTNIYKGDTFTDLSLERKVELPAGSVITDLEIYEINKNRTLFYTYAGDTTTLTSSIISADGDGQWTSVGVRIDGQTGFIPDILKQEEIVGNGTGTTRSITVPAGSNLAATIVLMVRGGTSTDITIDAVSASLVDSYTSIGGEVFYVYTKSLTAGTQDVVVTNTAGDLFTCYIIITGNTNATPVTEVEFLESLSQTAVSRVASQDDSQYITLFYAEGTKYKINGATAGTRYDSSLQTGAAGRTLWFKPDGTRMFLSGDTSSVYSYTLSTAWDVSTATYDSKTMSHAAQLASLPYGLSLNPDGTRLYLSEPNTGIYQYNLSTAWDLSTASYVGNESLQFAAPQVWSHNFNSDGTKLYGFVLATSALPTRNNVAEYSLSTPWEISTLEFVQYSPIDDSSFFYSFLAFNDSMLCGVNSNSSQITCYQFNPLYPGDVSKMEKSAYTAYDILLSGRGPTGIFIRPDGTTMFIRDAASVPAYSATPFTLPTAGSISLSSQDKTLFSFNQTATQIKVVNATDKKDMRCGILSIPSATAQNDDWLNITQNLSILTGSDYNFIRKADNGFAYLFTQNSIHKIDGGFTGGVDGTVTKNVIQFPDYFYITDAVDYRSNMYITVHQYETKSLDTDLENYAGTCGVIVWNKNSTALGGIEYIELPGVREIKRIYKSPDGVLKLISIGDHGITELRRFGYNDSGGVVFPVIKELGIGAYPQLPDGLTIAGDKVTWLANNGNLYCEKNGSVSILHQVATPGATTATLAENISSGVVAYTSGEETASSGFRSNKQGFVISYDNGVSKVTEKIYPFDLTTGSNGAQTPHAGNVYSAVSYIPITSNVKKVRVYNAPITGSGTDVIATVKLYFNQSTSAVMPNGMTKTITKDEAKRGYVDFSINKPFVHAVQIEIEWATSEPIGADMYLPSVAVINHDLTTTQSPDNG